MEVKQITWDCIASKLQNVEIAKTAGLQNQRSQALNKMSNKSIKMMIGIAGGSYLFSEIII